MTLGDLTRERDHRIDLRGGVEGARVTAAIACPTGVYDFNAD